MILVYGTVCLDRVLRVPHIPPPGGYVSIESEHWRLGGEAANTAFALKTWGGEFKFYGNHIGHEDLPGEPSREETLLFELLAEKGLEPSGHPMRRLKPPVCDIYVTPDGERTMFGLGFDKMSDGLHFHDAWLEGIDWFCIDMNFGEFGRDLVKRMTARCYLMDFVLPEDPIPPGSVWHSSTDWIGSKTRPKENLDLVKDIARQHQVTAILTDGPYGCYYATPDSAPRHKPPTIHPQIVDATGAGDTFRAAMLFGLDQDWPLDRCLDFALVAGSLKCQYPGATTRQATLDEIYAVMPKK